MMIRPPNDEGLMIIPQTDHSRFVGQLAAHWGNDQFETPRPYDSVARAAAFHDYGWLRYETDPDFDERTGETPDFIHSVVTALQLEGYAWTHDWLLGPDPYASLLSNMHRTGIWRGRYGAIQHPGHPTFPDLGPDIENFIAHSEHQQKEGLELLDKAEFRTNFRLLQVWDILGIYFCCQAPYADYIEPVPVRYDQADGEGVRMDLIPLSPTKVRFSPYPFDVPNLHVQISYKQLPRSRWPDANSFRKDYFRAETKLLDIELCA